MPTDYKSLAKQKAIEAARQTGLHPDTFANVFANQIGAESGYNPAAVSSAGAQGIAQIMPSTAKSWGVNPRDPVASLAVAAKNMAGYVKTYGGASDDPVKVRSAYEKALQAYNAGPGSVGKYMPTETKNYIEKIIGPSTFSFTESLKNKTGAQVPGDSAIRQVSPTGNTYIILPGDGPEGGSTAADFLTAYLSKGLFAKEKTVQPAFNPTALLTQAIFQTPNYLT